MISLLEGRGDYGVSQGPVQVQGQGLAWRRDGALPASSTDASLQPLSRRLSTDRCSNIRSHSSFPRHRCKVTATHVHAVGSEPCGNAASLVVIVFGSSIGSPRQTRIRSGRSTGTQGHREENCSKPALCSPMKILGPERHGAERSLALPHRRPRATAAAPPPRSR
jgi:hypothetical protein